MQMQTLKPAENSDALGNLWFVLCWATGQKIYKMYGLPRDYILFYSVTDRYSAKEKFKKLFYKLLFKRTNFLPFLYVIKNNWRIIRSFCPFLK
jgi:hypothetical protein